jgi:hypothetical protein
LITARARLATRVAEAVEIPVEEHHGCLGDGVCAIGTPCQLAETKEIDNLPLAKLIRPKKKRSDLM